MHSNWQAILLRQFLQRDLRPRANVLDDFGGSERTQPPGVLMANTAGKAEQESRREQIARAGGIDQFLDRKSRHRLDPSFEATTQPFSLRVTAARRMSLRNCFSAVSKSDV